MGKMSEHSAFAGMKDAKRGYASNPVREGQYLVRIDECSAFSSHFGFKWKNTLTVLSAIEGDHKPGEVVTATFTSGDTEIKKKAFQSKVKSLICGVLDCADEDVTEEDMDTILDEDKNPLKGHVTLLTVSKRQSRDRIDEKTGEKAWYSVFSWSPAYTTEEIRGALGDEDVARFFPNGLD